MSDIVVSRAKLPARTNCCYISSYNEFEGFVTRLASQDCPI